MKLLLLAIASTLLFISCSKSSIRGSGNTISEARTVPAFTGVQGKGSLNVEIKKGTQQRVEVRGYENLVPIFETAVTNGTLVLKFKNDYYNIRNNNITVYVETPDFQSIALDGSGDILLQNLTGADLSASINGSGNFNATNCTYTNSVFRINGSGRIRATQVISVNVDAGITGSGKIDVHCSQKLRGRIDGSGEINYWGNPTVVDAHVSGSGHIRQK